MLTSYRNNPLGTLNVLVWTLFNSILIIDKISLHVSFRRFSSFVLLPYSVYERPLLNDSQNVSLIGVTFVQCTPWTCLPRFPTLCTSLEHHLTVSMDVLGESYKSDELVRFRMED